MKLSTVSDGATAVGTARAPSGVNSLDKEERSSDAASTDDGGASDGGVFANVDAKTSIE